MALRLFALALLASGEHRYGIHVEHVSVAMAYLLLIVVVILLLLIAVLHDLVAATLRPKFWFTSLRTGDREMTHGRSE